MQATDTVACKYKLVLLHVVYAVMELLFSEELGLVLEVSGCHVETVCQRYSNAGVQCHCIGRTRGFGPEAMVRRQPQHYIYCLSSLVTASVTMVVFSLLFC